MVGVALATVLWVVGLAAELPSRSRVPLLPLCLSIGLLLLGWASLSHVGAVAAQSRTPAADIATTIRLEMRFITAMLLAGLIAADLGRDARGRRRASRMLVVTAAAIALVGAAGHFGLANPYARFMSDKEGAAPFGPFNYHANAGAFLNLALPLALLASGTDVLAATATAALAIGIAVNASKAAQAIAVVEGIGCAIVWWRTRRHDRPAPALPRPVLIGLIFIGLAAAAVGSRQAAHRWSKIASAIRFDSSRPTLWRVSWHMAQSAGWRGDGPGTFKLLFPHSPQMDPALYGRFIVRAYHPGERISMWNHVHDDYLQALIEWGWPGTALWVALFAGGLWTAVRGPDGRASAALVIAMASVLLHALVDFPLQVEVIRLDVAVLLGLAWSTPASRSAVSRRRPSA